MHIDEFLNVIRTRRSIRQFKPEPFPPEYVEKVLEAARWAMSGANAQPWEFIVVTQQAIKDRMAETYHQTRNEQYVIELTRTEDIQQNISSTLGLNLSFRVAPVLIVVLGDRRTLQTSILATGFIPSEGGPDAIYLKDMGNATQNIHLAASVLGLGSQSISVSHTWEQLLKPILNVPEILDIHTVVALGYPAQIPTKAFRRELKELIHHENYDRARYRSGADVINFVKGIRAFRASQQKTLSSQ